jgi:ribosomal protein S18 acetylase RimI-like enzyme
MITLDEIQGIRYGICEKSDINEMITLLGGVFSLFDPPAIALGITAYEFEAFVRLFGSKVLDQKVTIVARSVAGGEMAGALLTEDSATPVPIGMEQLSKKFDPIFSILSELESEYRHGKAVQPGKCLHLFLLGVARAYGGRGVAQNLIETCIHNGSKNGYRLAVTEATNNVSQHIFRKLGFIDRVARSYRDHTFEDKTPFARIEGHLGPVLMDKQIV